MKKNRLTAKILLFSFLINFSVPAFSQEKKDTTPKPYDNDELPQSIKDLRRFEIITLGSLPFVTLDTTLGYSTYRYIKHDFDSAYKPDIFSKSNFNQNEQLGIIVTSVCISTGIGLTDLIVQIVKRSNKKKRAKQKTYDDISIYPISEDPDAIELPLPQKKTGQEEPIEEIEE